MTKRRTNALLAIAIIMAILPVCTQAIPIPHGITGIVYMSDGVTQAPVGTSFSVDDTTSGDYIAGTTGAGPNSGGYSVTVNGEDGDTVILRAWNATHYGERTVILSGDMTDIDVIIMNRQVVVPSMTPLGTAILIGSLSILAAGRIRRRFG